MAEAPRAPFVAFDTSAEIDAMQVDAFRRLGGAERMAIAFRLTGMVRDLAMAGIRHRHPDYDAAQTRMAYARLTLGDAVVREAFPGQDLIEP
jgi:hypothetical protein